jgi:hypothetical protein
MGCQVGLPIRSRAEYASIGYDIKRRRKSRFSQRTCEKCALEAYLKLKEKIEQTRATNERRIASCLGQMEAGATPRDYNTISARHAFLLDGLLRYAGDSWREEHLDSWNQSRLHLCASKEDVESVYSELHSAGWIRPSPTSPIDAFNVDASGAVIADFLQVTWIVQPDLHGRPYSELLSIFESVQNSASRDELRAIWELVCLFELRAHFAFCKNRHFFECPGWTDGIRAALSNLLADCSLGHAKILIWRCRKSLKAQLEDGVYNAQRVCRMLPGSFQRAFDYGRSNGWPPTPWVDLRSFNSQTIYASHLFNRLLGGGQDLIDRVTGQSFSAHPKLPTNPS